MALCAYIIYIYIYIFLCIIISHSTACHSTFPPTQVSFSLHFPVSRRTLDIFFFILPFEFVAHRFSLYSTSFFSLSPLGFFGQLASGLSRHFPFSHGYLLCIKPRPRQPPENSSSVCLFSACSVQMEDTLGVINDVNGGRGILWVMSGQVGGM